LSRQTDQLRAFLADSDTPCPNCAYNLRTLTTDRCPECNEQLTLEARITNPRLGPLIAAAAGLLTGAGAAAAFFTVMGLYAIKRGGISGPAAAFVFTYYPVIVVVAEGSLSLLLLRGPGRTWFRRLQEPGRWLVILGAWGLTATAVFVFIRMIGM
jgi:hypothetical protein